MDNDHRADHIYNRAHALAVGGREPGEVVEALVREGFPEAETMLDSELIRTDLKRLSAETSASSDILAMLWSYDAMALAERTRQKSESAPHPLATERPVLQRQ